MKQQEWLLTRKKLLRRIKAQVNERLGDPPASIRQYAKKLASEFRGHWRACGTEEMLRVVTDSNVVFGSDFHAFAQSQRAHVRILRSLPGRRKVILAFECVCQEDQAHVDRYLHGGFSDDEFLKAVDWTSVWGFPWAHYRPLFELAKRRGFAITGLSRRPGAADEDKLTARDMRMAKDIAGLQRQNPDALIYVMVGELHLANSHLPIAWLSQAPVERAQSVIIFQDAEMLYFRLAERARDQNVEVLRSGHRFCLMVSPPWVKWQSYLMYLEQTYDRELDEDTDGLDYSDHLKSLVDLLARDFDLVVSTSHLQVYTPSSKETLKQLKRNLPRKSWSMLLYHLANDRSFLLPEKGLIYLSTPTLNRAAHLAGEFLHAQLCRRMTPLWNGMESFHALIWVEAAAFFFGKWINPKRKAETFDNLKHQLAVLSPRDRGAKALLLALDQRMSDTVWIRSGRRRRLRATARRMSDILEAARIVGSMVGERLFVAVRSGEVTPVEIVDWLQFPVTDPDFDEFYRRLLTRLK